MPNSLNLALHLLFNCRIGIGLTVISIIFISGNDIAATNNITGLQGQVSILIQKRVFFWCTKTRTCFSCAKFIMANNHSRRINLLEICKKSKQWGFLLFSSGVTCFSWGVKTTLITNADATRIVSFTMSTSDIYGPTIMDNTILGYVEMIANIRPMVDVHMQMAQSCYWEIWCNLTCGTMNNKILDISVAMIFRQVFAHGYRYYYQTLLSKLLLKHNRLSICHKLYFW